MSDSRNTSPQIDEHPFNLKRLTAFTIYRWLFVFGGICTILQILGVSGNSDITEIVTALKSSDFATVIFDVLTDGLLIGTVLYAIFHPKRSAFVLGASLAFFPFWLALLTVTGVTKGSLADQFAYMQRIGTLTGLIEIIGKLFPLFGFLAFHPNEFGMNVHPSRRRKAVEIAVPVVAGVLLTIVPTRYFTGSLSWNESHLTGFLIEVFVVGGILVAITGILRKPSLNLFWGTTLSMWLLEIWVVVTQKTGPTKPSYWPGVGMILGIVSCLLLLFSIPITKMILSKLPTRKPGTVAVDSQGGVSEHQVHTTWAGIWQLVRLMSKRNKIILGGGVGILCLIIILLLTLSSVPGEVNHVVFQTSNFAAPITLSLPCADSPNAEQDLRRNLQGLERWPSAPPVWWLWERSSATSIQPNVLNLLEKNGFAKVSRFSVRWPGDNSVHTFSFISYASKIQPYVVQGSPQFTPGGGRFQVVLGYRVLESIDYHNEYEMNAAVMDVKMYALTFTYKIQKGDLPGVSVPSRTYRGEARAYRDPTDGAWKLDALSLSDKGSNEFKFEY